MDIDNPKDIWDILKKTCLKVNQQMIYLVLYESLNYPYIHKLKRYDKSAIEIFAEIRFFFKQFKAAMTTRYDLFDIISMVIIFDTLYSDFETTIASILKIGDKTRKEI